MARRINNTTTTTTKCTLAASQKFLTSSIQLNELNCLNGSELVAVKTGRLRKQIFYKVNPQISNNREDNFK